MARTMAESSSKPSPGPGAGKSGFDALQRAGHRCLLCARELDEGESLTAVLIELARSGGPYAADAPPFERLDYCQRCWPQSPWTQAEAPLDEGLTAHPTDLYGAEPIAVWTVRVPPRQQKKRTFLDDRVLAQFFLKLADDDEPQRQQFRFVLMLILMRHRKLRHVGIERDANGDAWLVTLSPAMAEALGASPDDVHRVIDPQLDPTRTADVAIQLSQILHEDLDTTDPPEAPL